MEDIAESEAESAPKKKFSIFGLITALFLAVIALVGVYGIVMSLQKYTPSRGMVESPWVGLQNYEKFFSSNYFTPSMVNSVALRALQLLGGTVLALPLIAWVCLGKKPGRTLTKACLCLIPFCLPYVISAQAVIALVPRDIRLSSNGAYLTFTLTTALQTAGFIGFCGGFFSYLKQRGIGKGAPQGVLVALLISALSLLTTDNNALLMLANALNRGSTMTLDYYAYTLGIVQGNYSFSSAVSAVKALLQVVVAIVPALLLCRIAKKDETRVELPDAKGAFFTFTGANIVWLILLAALVVATFGIETVARMPEESLNAFGEAAQSMISSLPLTNLALVTGIVAVLGGLLAGLTSFSFIAYFRSGRKGFGLAMIIAASAFSFISAELLAVRNVGLLNTPWPMVLRAAADPRLLCLTFALAIVLRMAPERRTRGVVIGLMLLAAAFAWGDYFGANLYAYSSNNSTFAQTLYRLIIQGGVTSSSESVSQATLLARQAQTPLVSLLVSVPALLLGFGGAAACIRGFKDAK